MARLARTLAFLGAAAVVLYAGVRLLSPAELSGPVPIVWDKEPCAHCRMHIGDPRFAAQLQTASGRIASFDDPGCLFAHLQAEALDVARIYFRHVRDDRWISSDDVAFVRVTPTPMGFGIGAVDRSEPGSLRLEEVRELIRTGVLHGDRPASGEHR